MKRFSTLINPLARNLISVEPTIPRKPSTRILSSLPIPHRTIPQPKGQDLDFVNVAHSHLIHSDWAKLDLFSSCLTAFRVKHILLNIQKDHVLSLEFFNWVQNHKPSSHTLETHSIIFHILTKNRKFKSAESVLRNILFSDSLDFPAKVFEALLYSYCLCDSSPIVFDSLFKSFAHMKKFRNASNTFCRMKEYGFLPTVESCNAYLSSLIELHRADIALRRTLDLSHNSLSGRIPQQLAELTFLEVFDVSSNLLTGPIPQTKQFATFQRSSFEGNQGLCGNPLSKKCEDHEKSSLAPPSGSDEDQEPGSLFDFGWKVVLMGYGCGLVVGLVLGST